MGSSTGREERLFELRRLKVEGGRRTFIPLWQPSSRARARTAAEHSTDVDAPHDVLILLVLQGPSTETRCCGIQYFQDLGHNEGRREAEARLQVLGAL